MEFLAGLITGMIFGVAAAVAHVRDATTSAIRTSLERRPEPPLLLLDWDDREEGAVTG